MTIIILFIKHLICHHTRAPSFMSTINILQLLLDLARNLNTVFLDFNSYSLISLFCLKYIHLSSDKLSCVPVSSSLALSSVGTLGYRLLGTLMRLYNYINTAIVIICLRVGHVVVAPHGLISAREFLHKICSSGLTDQHINLIKDILEHPLYMCIYMCSCV